MKTLLYANRAEPNSISVISILLLAAVGDITKLRCMHRECYIFASQNLWNHTIFHVLYIFIDKSLMIHNETYYSRVPYRVCFDGGNVVYV